MNHRINVTLLLDSALSLSLSFWSYFIVVNQQPIAKHYLAVQMIAYKLPSLSIFIAMVIADLIVANLAGRQIFNNVYLNFALVCLTVFSCVNYLSFKLYNTYALSVFLIAIAATILAKVGLDFSRLNKWYYASAIGCIITILFIVLIKANLLNIIVATLSALLSGFAIRQFPTGSTRNIKRIFKQFLGQYRHVY